MRVHALAAGLIAVAAPAVPAAPSAAFTLSLTGPATGIAGQPLVIQASGNDPTDQGALYLELDEISATAVSSCPAGYLDAAQLASSTGGRLIALDQRENLDAAGDFSIPIGYTPGAAGPQLLCAYTDDGATDTLATAQLQLSVTAMPEPAPVLALPVNTAKPRVSRSGARLTCDAGTWSGSPSAFHYAWLVDGRARRGATARRLAITHALRKHEVRCRVTASNAAGAGHPATSRAIRVR